MRRTGGRKFTRWNEKRENRLEGRAPMATFTGWSPASAMVVVWLAAWAVMEVHCSEESSFETYWERELPAAAMPEALKKAASPLSASSAQELLAEMKRGRPGALQVAMAAGESKRVVAVGGSQPRVCIPPYFKYEYGVLPCRPPANAADAARQSAVFFKPESLQEATRVRLPDTRNPLGGAAFLPPALSSALPMSPARASALLSLFAIPADSVAALHVRNTLAHCAQGTSAHDPSSCHTSGESMVSFVAKALGPRAIVAYVPARAAPHQAKQPATVLHVGTLARPGDRVVACHNMEFPSLLYSCHLSSSSRVLDVSLQLQDGTHARGLAACHMDTSYWNSDHVAFQALNVKPGQGAVCHWFPENSFVFTQG